MLLYCLAAINLFNAADLFLYSPSRLKASKNIFPLTIFARNFNFSVQTVQTSECLFNFSVYKAVL